MPRKNKDKGIYKITQLSTKLVYIGSSTDVYGRMVIHRNNLQKNKCDSVRLQQAYNKNPDINDFSFEVIEILPNDCTKEQLLDREDYWINEYNSRDIRFGLNWSKARYSGENHASMKGINNPNYGKKHNKDSKFKMRNSWDTERRNKLSERTKKYWENYRLTHNK